MKYFIGILLVLLLALAMSCKSSSPEVVNSPGETSLASEDEIPPRATQVYIDACTEMIKGDYTEAISGFQEVLDIAPSYHSAQFNIAKISLELREYSDAISFGKAALQGDPSNYWYRKILEEAYEAQGNFEEAIGVQEELVRQNPQKIEDRLLLARLYQKNNQGSKSVRVLDELEAEVGGGKKILLKKIEILEAQEEWKLCLLATEKLIDQYPEAAGYYELKYRFLEKLGRADEGIEALEKLAEANPTNGFATLKLADYYKREGQIEKSDTYLFQSFANPTVDPEGKLSIISQLLDYADQNKEEVVPRAKKLATIFQQTHPGSSKADLLQAKIFAYQGRLDSARYGYLSGLQANSTNIDLWYELLELDQKIGDFLWLYRDGEEALTYYPNQKEILYAFGLGAASRGKWNMAEYALEKADRLHQEVDDFAKKIESATGYSRWAQGKMAGAEIEDFVGNLKKSKGEAISSLFLARYLLEEGNSKDAVQVLEKIYKENGRVYVDLINIHISKARYSEAERWLQLALEKGKSPTLFEAWGDLLYQQGKAQEARKKWAKAIEMGADELDINQKLNQ